MRHGALSTWCAKDELLLTIDDEPYFRYVIFCQSQLVLINIINPILLQIFGDICQTLDKYYFQKFIYNKIFWISQLYD